MIAAETSCCICLFSCIVTKESLLIESTNTPLFNPVHPFLTSGIFPKKIAAQAIIPIVAEFPVTPVLNENLANKYSQVFVGETGSALV